MYLEEINRLSSRQNASAQLWVSHRLTPKEPKTAKSAEKQPSARAPFQSPGAQAVCPGAEARRKDWVPPVDKFRADSSRDHKAFQIWKKVKKGPKLTSN